MLGRRFQVAGLPSPVNWVTLARAMYAHRSIACGASLREAASSAGYAEQFSTSNTIYRITGALRGGRDVWMLARFNVDSPAVREVFADEVILYGLISNNHPGHRKVMVQETPVRVVCAKFQRFQETLDTRRDDRYLVAARHQLWRK